MTIAERTMNKYQNELDKLNTQLERAQATYEKKLEAAKKLGVADWTIEDREEWLKTVPTAENGWIINKEDTKKNGAWFDLSCAESRIKEIKNSIERKIRILNKSTQEVKIQSQKNAELEAEKARAKMIENWAKDGITITDMSSNFITGYTPKNNHFSINSNDGFTERSLHCFTLYVEGKVIFTSGEFYRAYHEIKNR